MLQRKSPHPVSMGRCHGDRCKGGHGDRTRSSTGRTASRTLGQRQNPLLREALSAWIQIAKSAPSTRRTSVVPRTRIHVLTRSARSNTIAPTATSGVSPSAASLPTVAHKRGATGSLCQRLDGNSRLREGRRHSSRRARALCKAHPALNASTSFPLSGRAPVRMRSRAVHLGAPGSAFRNVTRDCAEARGQAPRTRSGPYDARCGQRPASNPRWGRRGLTGSSCHRPSQQSRPQSQ